MNERKSKNIVIIALCITLIFMGVGFSALSSRITINGTASTSSSWDVRITDIQATEAYTSANDTTITDDASLAAYEGEKISSTQSTATFDATLAQPGDYVIYSITVKNQGTIGATLNSLTETIQRATENAGVEGAEAREPIKFQLQGLSTDSPANVLAAETGEVTFTVKAYYDATVVGEKAPDAGSELLSRTYSLVLEYVQA